jgi:hypothetical protein
MNACFCGVRKIDAFLATNHEDVSFKNNEFF